MAKQTMSRLSWRWSKGFRATSLPTVFLAVFCPGNMLRAGDVVPSNSPSQATTTALLEYQETGYSVITWSVSITPHSVPFKKEPAAVPGKVVRGVLNFGGSSSNSIPFLWQRDAGKLYLDLNHNQDLTDDPEGAFSARVFRPTSYQTFTNVHLLFNIPSGKCPVLADISFWDFGSRPNGNLAVRSFWQGKATLQGRDWQVGIVPNVMNQPGSLETGQLLLRPWEERDKAFNAYGGSLDTFPFSRKLFVGDHAYQLTCLTTPQNGELKPALQYTEQPVALGELKITGQFIRRLVLPGGPYLVVLDHPAASVKVPVGTYRQPNIRLAQNGAEAFCLSDFPQSGNRITVDDKTPVALNVGGPLTNSVTATRHGQDLRLDYRLIGAGGAIYQLANSDRSKPPEFAIYKGDKKIASGKFEFG